MHETLISLFLSFPYAVLAGLLIGVACALLGVFVILKRVVFIGIALSEMAACGVAMALLLSVPPFVGAVVLTLLTVCLLALPFESRRIPRDAILGVLFVAASSLSVLLVSGSGHGLQEVKSLLYGDLILTSRADFFVVCGVMLPAIACLLVFMRPTLYAFLDRESATVLRVRPGRWELLFFLILGLVVAAASKVAGAVLVFCYLIAPAAAALLLARRLWLVLTLACLFAVLATLFGIGLSFSADLPTNQTICAVACLLFAFCSVVPGVRRLAARRRGTGVERKTVNENTLT
jgi:ABC-type Mn2+/Zn2+ transport system permease subunit